MSNKVMIDTSLLVEYIKDAKKQLLVSLISNSDNECCINETVISEFMYHFLSVDGNASPRSLQSSNKIKKVLDSSPEFSILNRFSFLPGNEFLFKLVPSFMKQCNLLPNDAIILATCKIHSMTQLTSHDKDFEQACNGEGIVLLKEK
jgi:predicted nucleic acid-binding protein